MARSGRMVAAFGLFLGLSLQSWAQTIWADVRVNKSSVYVGEPVEVSVKVYTSTWFTRGLDLGNIKVKDAFSVYFRPVSISFQRDGQTYAGVEQIYHVFPYEVGKMTFPVFDIQVESPAPGGFKGVAHTVESKEQVVTVKPPPSSFDSKDWLVAGGLNVSESWSGSDSYRDRKQVKVGDVLERRITRTAYSTVSELIPPIVWDSLPGVSEYPARSAVSNHKDKTSFSATRTETVRYLFEKEGEVTVPEMVFNWYNPYHDKLYKRTLKAVTIQVQANPDLGVLASVRDSLGRQLEEVLAEEAAGKPKTILGMSLKRFAALLSLSLAGLVLLIFLTKKILAFYHRKRQAYLHSERFYWDAFNREFSVGALYRWIDELHLNEPTVECFVSQFGSERLIGAFSRGSSSGKLPPQLFDQELRKDWAQARTEYLERGRKVERTSADWINPQAS